MRGAFDLGGVVNRMTARSKYGGWLLFLNSLTPFLRLISSKEAKDKEVNVRSECTLMPSFSSSNQIQRISFNIQHHRTYISAIHGVLSTPCIFIHIFLHNTDKTSLRDCND